MRNTATVVTVVALDTWYIALLQLYFGVCNTVVALDTWYTALLQLISAQKVDRGHTARESDVSRAKQAQKIPGTAESVKIQRYLNNTW